MIVQYDRELSGVMAVYGAGGDHDTMVSGHTTSTGYKTKLSLMEVYLHASINFFCLTGFDGDLFSTV